MSYAGLEASVQDGQPIELYLFTNFNSTFAYTNSNQEYNYAGNLYLPKPISRGEPELIAEQTDRTINLEIPADDDFVLRYVNTVPATKDELIVFRLHTTDGGTPEVIQFFKGTVASIVFEGELAKIVINTSGKDLAEIFPKQTCRNPCNHALYDSRCAILESEFSIQGAVDTISLDGLFISMDTGTAVVPDTGLQLTAQLIADPTFFDAGFLRIAGLENRMIRSTQSHGGNRATLEVLLGFEGIGLGSTITMQAGCSRDLNTCRDKFNNVQRYGGFPYVPLKNLFSRGVKV